MLTIPIRINATEYSIFVVLEDENLTRMRWYDPAEVVTSKMGEWAKLKVRDIIIGYGSADDIAEVHRLSAEGKGKEALRLLTRGWKFRPLLGDSDESYTPLPKKP